MISTFDVMVLPVQGMAMEKRSINSHNSLVRNLYRPLTLPTLFYIDLFIFIVVIIISGSITILTIIVIIIIIIIIIITFLFSSPRCSRQENLLPKSQPPLSSRGTYGRKFPNHSVGKFG